MIQKSTIKFLKDLALNNDRDWFANEKPKYIKSQQNIIDFVDALILEMKKHDHIDNTSGKASLYRIYNDVRFSKDKSPYNARFAFGFRRSTKLLRGGYYMNIKPGNTYLACGFFSPNAEDLHRIRLDILDNNDQWKKVLNSRGIKKNFGELQGDQLTTAPRGFDKDHPSIKYIRYKQLFLRHDFTDKEVLSENFVKEVNQIFRSVRPFFDLMSEILTTNLNGELIV